MKREQQSRAPRVGRPIALPEDERRRLLLDEAARQFTAQGYENTTMDAVAAAAGMSKKTLYRLFDSKLALFDALLQDRFVDLPINLDLTGYSQKEALTRLMLAIAETLLHPDRTALARLLAADGNTSPDVQTAFERLRMNRKQKEVEAWLTGEQEAGRLDVGDIDQAAHLLFSMTIAEPILLTLLHARRLPDEPPIEARIAYAVDIFLRGLNARR